ncbi:MAG: protease inhibitor I42 family protein, partial [Bacteroidales bacterium]|nr:protease inhibitor I42 family protein [Bacteroidales bacterium]
MRKGLLSILLTALVWLGIVPMLLAQSGGALERRFQEDLSNDKLGTALKALDKKVVIDGISYEEGVLLKHKASLKIDELLVIFAEAIPSAGYSWVLQVDNQHLLEVIAEDFEPSKGAGGNVKKRFVLRAKAKGISTLTLEYKRAWETNVAPLSTSTIVVSSEGAYAGKFSFVKEQQVQKSLRKADYAVKGLPSKFDWRDLNGATSVKNQGNSNACWSFGSIAAFEGIIKAKTGVEEDLSEQWLGNCNVSGFSVKDGGWFPQYMFVQHGAVTEAEVPFTQTNGQCNAPYFYLEKATSWSYVDFADEPWPQKTHSATVEQLKQALYTYGPLAIDVYTTGDGNGWFGYTNGVYAGNNTGGGHIVCLVGWDDSNQCWIIKNSWGPDWGENGYIRIRYNTGSVGAYAVYLNFEPSGKKARITASSGKIRETPNNDGALNGVTLSLSGAAFKTSDFTSSDYRFTGLPTGITAQVKRTNDTQAELIFSGRTANHSQADNVENFTLEFNASAFDGTPLSDFYNSTLTLPILFRNPYKIIYQEMSGVGASFASPWLFFELGYFDGEFGTWYFTDAKYPDMVGNLKLETYGKKMVCHRGTFNIGMLNFGEIIGSQSYWRTYDDYPNQLELYNKAYTNWVGKTGYAGFVISGDGGPCYGWMRISVADDAKSYVIHDFAFNEAPNQPIKAGEKSDGLKPELSFSPSALVENLDNNGVVTPSVTIKVNGDTFVSPFGLLSPEKHYKLTGVPAGLTVTAKSIDANTVQLSISGAAIEHSVNTSFEIEFLDAMFASGAANLVLGYKSSIPIQFKKPYTIVSGDFSGISVNASSIWAFFALENELPFGAWYFNSQDVPAMIGDLKIEAYSTEILSHTGTYNIKYISADQLIGPQETEFNTYGTVYPNQHALVSKTHRTFVGQTGYVGFRFAVEDRYCYGWLKVKVNATGTGFEVLSYAYNEAPNSPLRAGSTTMPTENFAPVFDTNPVLNAKIGELYSYIIRYSDSNPSQNLTITADKPSWMTFEDLGNGRAKLSGVPAITENANVRLTLSDGIATTHQQFQVKVVAMDAPVSEGIVYVLSNTKFDKDNSWILVSLKDAGDIAYGLYTNQGNCMLYPNNDNSLALCSDEISNVVLLDSDVEVGPLSQGRWAKNGWTYFNDEWKGKTKFVAISFKVKAKTHYGWMRFAIAADGNSGELIDYAYQKAPDTPIKTGQSELPVANREPIFSSVPVNFALVGRQYSYDIKVVDPDGAPLQLSATGLPAWLSLSIWSNGVARLSGKPSSTSSSNIVLTANDGKITASQNFTLTVAGGALTYSTTSISEADENDGSFTNKISINLQEASFALTSGTLSNGQHFTVSGLPQGLAVKLTALGSNEVVLSLEGKAVNPDTDASFTITFKDDAFSNALAVDIANTSMVIDLHFRPSFRIVHEALTGIAVDKNSIWKVFETQSEQSIGAWYFNSASHSNLIGNLKIEAYDNDMLTESGAGFNLKLLNSGDEVSSISSEWKYYDEYPNQHTLYSASHNLFAGKQAFVGFRYPANTTQFCYGWLKVEVKADGTGFSILEYAYNEAPDKPIYAGLITIPTVFSLTYTAGANGSITGEANQTVEQGANGTAVEAVPATGYHFVKWSDGLTANPRTDANVTANITVEAEFAQDAVATYTLTYTA